MTKTALITGVMGQDGSLLAEFLLAKGYQVHGLRLYAAVDDTVRLAHFREHPAFHLHYADMNDGGSLWQLLARIRPDEIYNLAGQSHVGVSFKTPEATVQINALGTLRLLEAIRGLGLADKTRFYQASSSEMFGNAPAPQNEDTPFQPCSPYGASKVCAYWLVRNYREAYGLYAGNGILFNHESPVRGEEFVTRKITRAVAMIEAGMLDELKLGNLNAERDWGHARDYIEGMWLMLQQDKAGDYVLATGKARSVREFVSAAFACAGMNIHWRGIDLDEKGYDARTGRLLVSIDPQYVRPSELHTLIGDAARARRELGWQPRHDFAGLVREMVAADRALVAQYAGSGQVYDAALLAAE